MESLVDVVIWDRVRIILWFIIFLVFWWIVVDIRLGWKEYLMGGGVVIVIRERNFNGWDFNFGGCYEVVFVLFLCDVDIGVR